MERFRVSLVLGLGLIVFITLGCATTQVSRVDSEQTIDLTGKWNDSDSRRVAEKMIESVLDSGWIDRYTDSNNDRPTVIVGLFRNRSSEHIDEETFTKDIERELINSGKVRFVAMEEEREALKKEREHQSLFSSDESRARLVNELGADFMLQGSFHSQNQKLDGQEVRAYEVHMQLLNIETNEKVWVGTREIKKRVERSAFGL